jgi:hypothetical protein
VRCWHFRADVGSHAEHPELCGRCVDNVDGAGETAALVLMRAPARNALIWLLLSAIGDRA